MFLVNLLYPAIKFTLFFRSPAPLNVSDLTVNFFRRLYPLQAYIYLLRNSAYPTSCAKTIPFRAATKFRRNCSTLKRLKGRV